MDLINKKLFLCLLFPTVILIIIATCYGIFSADTYVRETENWKAQAIAQDIVDLFLIAPVLLVSGLLSLRRQRIFVWLFGGTIVFLIYTYALYCFAVHFNFLFLIYCLTFGLSVYLLIYFIATFYRESLIVSIRKPGTRWVGIFFILIGVVFYFLWLSEIIPSILQNTTPASLLEAGLITNPVHVIDISIVLPGFIIVAILLLRRKPAGFFLAPVLLVFCVLMNLSIAVLVIVMKLRGVSNDMFVAWVMAALALISAALLYVLHKMAVSPKNAE